MECRVELGVLHFYQLEISRKSSQGIRGGDLKSWHVITTPRTGGIKPDTAYDSQDGMVKRSWDWECGLTCYLCSQSAVGHWANNLTSLCFGFLNLSS